MTDPIRQAAIQYQVEHELADDNEREIRRRVDTEMAHLIKNFRVGDILTVLENISERECGTLEDISIRMQKGALDASDYKIIGASFVDMIYSYHRGEFRNDAE